MILNFCALLEWAGQRLKRLLYRILDRANKKWALISRQIMILNFGALQMGATATITNLIFHKSLIFMAHSGLKWNSIASFWWNVGVY